MQATDIMTKQQPTNEAKRRSAALATWRVYKRWAVASAGLKRSTDALKTAVLVLSLIALVLGPLATARPEWLPTWAIKVVGLISALVVALSAYLSDKVLGTDRDVAWVRAREAAEGLKSLVYAFLAGIPPFNGPNAIDALEAQRKQVEEAPALASLVALPISDGDAEKGFPPLPFVYATGRAKEQKSWFESKARFYSNEVSKYQIASKVLVGIAVALGVVAGTFSWLGVWVAMVSSVAATLATQVTTSRSRFLEKSYSDAAARLGAIIDRWEWSDKAEADDKQLAFDSEAVLRQENAGWVATMLAKPPAPPQSGSPSGAASPVAPSAGPATPAN
jgi:hypothetical protein